MELKWINLSIGGVLARFLASLLPVLGATFQSDGYSSFEPFKTFACHAGPLIG